MTKGFIPSAAVYGIKIGQMKGGATSLIQVFRFKNAFGGENRRHSFLYVRNVRVGVQNATMTRTDAKYIIVYSGIGSAI